MHSHRAAGGGGGEHAGSGFTQQITRENAAVGHRLYDLLEDFERLALCWRATGAESVWPLRADRAAPPLTLERLEERMQLIERDFLGPGHLGSRRVYGVPLNQPYTDDSHVWEAIRDSRILELGGESAEYVFRVRAFPYPCRVLSVWVFVACATGE